MGNKQSELNDPKWKKCKILFYASSVSKIVNHNNRILFMGFNGDIREYDLINDELNVIKLFDYDKSKFVFFIGDLDRYIRKLAMIECGHRPSSPHKSSTLFYINNTLHIIGGHNFPYYIDTTNISFQTALNGIIEPNYSFLEYTSTMKQHQIIYIKSENMILLFFMGNKSEYQSQSLIYSYWIDIKLWKKINVDIPFDFNHFGAVLVPGDQYIIIIKDDCIFVYDIDKITFYQSKIELPQDRNTDILGGNYIHPVIASDYFRLDIIIAGYIRELRCIKISKISQDLIRTICQFYCNEYMLHLFEYQINNGGWWGHAKIAVDVILNQLTEIDNV